MTDPGRKAIIVFLLVFLPPAFDLAQAGEGGSYGIFGTHPWLPASAGRNPPASAGRSPAFAQQRDLPDEEAFFNAVRENMARASREQHRYAYKERRTELHTNPFGRLGTDGVVVYEVTPGPEPGVTFRKLLERDGKAVLNSRPERQERRVRAQAVSSVDDTVAALTFAIDRREVVGGRRMIVVRFEPRKDADPKTREGRLAKAFKGRIWVDEEVREVAKVEATAVDNLSYGFGLLARLNKGGVVTLTRERIDDRIWLPTSITFKGNGRALLAIRKLTIDFAVEWFDYRRT
jgi:hypothetical protein